MICQNSCWENFSFSTYLNFQAQNDEKSNFFSWYEDTQNSEFETIFLILQWCEIQKLLSLQAKQIIDD